MKLPPVKTDERLDIHVSRILNLPRNKVRTLIKEGLITVNGKQVKPGITVSSADMIDMAAPPPTPEAKPSRFSLSDLDLLYEDGSIIVLNKPAGLVVHRGTGDHDDRTLCDLLKQYTPRLSTLGGEERPGIVHRLDKDTEGLMVIAKNDHVHQQLKNQFQDKKIMKGYYAVVKGDIKDHEFEIDAPIERHPFQRYKYHVAPVFSLTAKPALTRFKVLKRYQSKTLLQVTPITGRTHQIRVHLAHIGHPILGDPVYGTRKWVGKGQLLQAFRLGFHHPHNPLILTFTLPPSKRLGM